MSAPFVAVGDLVLHARREGDPARPLVVFVNSLGTDARIWQAVVERLAPAYGALLYDMRGHGLSDAPPGAASIEDHADDLVGVLDRLGVARCALVGLSVGGMIAQVVAARHAERLAALVLCDTAARIGDAASWNARIAAAEGEGLGSIATPILDRWFTPAYRAAEPAAMAGWRNMLTRQPAHGYAALCAAIRDADLRSVASGIRVPTLCVVGDQDLSTPPELVRGTADLIPGARFALVENAGHIPCVEQPSALVALIRDYLSAAGFR